MFCSLENVDILPGCACGQVRCRDAYEGLKNYEAKSYNLPARVVSDRYRTYRARSGIVTQNLCIVYCPDMWRTHLECCYLST